MFDIRCSTAVQQQFIDPATHAQLQAEPTLAPRTRFSPSGVFFNVA
jgi:hypothetical protein